MISHRADYEYAREAISRYGITERAAAIHMSPVHGVMDPKTLSEWVLADRLPVRVQLQIQIHLAGRHTWRPAAAAAGSGAAAQRRSRLLHGRGDCARGRLRLHALTVRYGQRHARELETRWLRAVAARARSSRHIELDVDLSAFGGVIADNGCARPGHRRIDAADIPSTCRAGAEHRLPGTGTRLCEVLGAHDLVIGVNALDYSDIRTAGPGVPAFEQLASLATARGVSGETFRITLRFSI